MEGRDDKLERSHFVAFGERAGLRRAAIEKMLDSLIKRIAPGLTRLNDLGFDAKRTQPLERTMRERLGALGT